MIELTKLHNEKIVVNADLIEFVEATPDTLISTTTGKKVMVKETVQEVVDRVVAYKQRLVAGPQSPDRAKATTAAE
jgi:flagellar protein FlbD